MSKAEENRINSLAVAFLEKQQIQPNIFADQIIRGYKEGYHQAEKDVIEKVCVLLEDKISENCYGNNLDFIVGTIYNIDFLDIEGLIDDIKQAMKDE